MQPLSPYRPRYGNTNDEDSSSPAQANARGAPTPPADPSALPDLRDPSLALPSTQLKPQAMVDSLTTRIRDQAMRQGLDDFLQSMTPEFRTPEGPALVPVTFQMTTNYSNQPRLETISSDPRMKVAMNDAHIPEGRFYRILQGRGTASEVRALTQALIDRNGLPPGPGSVAERVREVMFAHHIGVDCADYTQLAFLFATGLSRNKAGFREDEDLSILPRSPAYRRIECENVRPGDICVLGPPPKEEVGHRVIVYGQHLATDGEMDDLHSMGAHAATFATRQPIRVFQVDSSWGCAVLDPTAPPSSRKVPAANPQNGGVIRVTWWYSETTKEWAIWDSNGFHVTPIGPYDHPLVGFYRRRDSESLALPALKGQS
ncbi:MAG TPA: hypothetical protein VK841_12650 [Polyangiaceae bacterium]|jgi:hypothetical protein|nr:hypothetical protein [Polyangiaceae bacterium]